MFRLTLAQMRRSLGRLVAAGVAIAIGTAFVAATLLTSDIFTRTTHAALTSSYGQADLVVTGGGVPAAATDRIADVAGVDAVRPVQRIYVELAHGTKVSYVPVEPLADDARLQTQTISAGQAPSAGQVAIPADVAERLELGVGDTVAARFTEPSSTGDGLTRTDETLTVSGLTDDPGGAFASQSGAALADPADAARWAGLNGYATGANASYDTVLVALAPGADLERVRADIRAAIPADADAQVRTRDEQADATLESRTGSANLLTGVVLAFAAVALIVASLVIANTFQVLVAQRRRTLALLRCVGATRAQVRRSVVTEALLLGVASSAAGILAGTLLAQLLLVVLGRRYPSVPLPEVAHVSVPVFLVPMVAGVVVTVLAALAPAREAGRVAPLAALRPADAPQLRRGGGRVRLASAIVLVVAGAGLLALGIAFHSDGASWEILARLGLGVLGGLLSFVGVLIGAVFWIPRTIGGLGRLVSRVTGPTGRLATANTVRNPRRTAATSSALLIGVTLVAMMSAGAASMRQTMSEWLDGQFPVDIAVTDLDAGPDGALDDRLLSALRGVDGVSAVEHLTQAGVTMTSGPDGDTYNGMVLAVAPDDAATVVRASAQVGGLKDGAVLVPERIARQTHVATGDRVELRADAGDGSASGPGVAATVVVTTLPQEGLLVTPTTLGDMAPPSTWSTAWLRVSDDATSAAVVADVQSVLRESSVAIEGAAVERTAYDQVIDTMLAVVVGLLGVAVVIALVGVANTLSLSVIERRRESATLRAIGLSRRQLRQSLATEGMLIAGSGALLGAVLGTVYGWLGTQTLLGTMTDTTAIRVTFSASPRDLALVLAVALAAGLLASVVPARGATRTPPVAALAVE